MKKTRIILYRPPAPRQSVRMSWLFSCEPLELEYLFTVLEDMAELKLIDGQVWPDRLLREVRRWKPDILMITSMITGINRLLKLAAKVKEMPHSPLVFVGGPHAEVVPEHYFSGPIDVVFHANQLQAVRQVVRAFSTGESLQGITGIAYQENGRFIKNDPAPPEAASLPVPGRPFLEQHARRYRFLYYRDCASLKTSFGCPENCSFCFCRKMNGSKYQRRPLASVMEEIESIPVQNIFIVDDNFLAGTSFVEEFCREIAARKISKRFIAYMTAGDVAARPGLMKKLKAAGLSAIVVGFEFIEDASLEEYRKRTTRQDNEDTIRICRELEIDLVSLFMIRPEWEPRQFRELLRYVRSRQLYFSTFGTVTLLPGTDLWEEQAITAAGNEKWWRYDLLRLHASPRHMSPFRFYLWLALLYVLPSMGRQPYRYYTRRFGSVGTFRLWLTGVYSSADYLLKLLVWP